MSISCRRSLSAVVAVVGLAVSLLGGVAAAPSGPVSAPQATAQTAGTRLEAPVAPTLYPFPVDAAEALAGRATLTYKEQRPVAIDGRFSQLIRFSGQHTTPSGTATVTPLDYTFTMQLPEGARYSGSCALVRYYAGTSTLARQSDGTITCAQDGPTVSVTVRTDSTVNDVLLGLEADRFDEVTGAGPIPYTLDVSRFAAFPPLSGVDPRAGLAPISGTLDLGAVAVPPGHVAPAPTHTVPAPEPTRLPDSWPAPPAPPTPVWEKGPWGSLDKVMGSVSDGIMKVDPDMIPIPAGSTLPDLP